jgi:hypothetical protein
MAVIRNVIRPGAAKPNPFTICIVGNPVLEVPWNSGTVIKDPIIGQLVVFQAAATYIDSALFGLLPGQRENLLADPAIMPSIRVVSIYDDGLPTSLTNALVAQDSDSRLLIARRNAFVPFLAKYDLSADVIYAVSASVSHNRASAWYTTDDDSRPGVSFNLDGVQYHHRYYNLIPGTIAIHATASSLTAVHEFGHAISSYSNGRIVDLYADSPPAINNKRGRPIPPLFCNYESSGFSSDLTRDGLGYDSTWQSYHCELIDPTCPAVMDDYWSSAKGPEACLHDAVTKAFIRDRVAAKISRP